jgi:hypothetical protein
VFFIPITRRLRDAEQDLVHGQERSASRLALAESYLADAETELSALQPLRQRVPQLEEKVATLARKLAYARGEVHADGTPVDGVGSGPRSM